MRGEFKNPVKDKGAALEEDIAPVPAIVFYNIVSFCLHPKIESYQGYSSDPSEK